MIKQCGHYITFQEVPNEISLTFTISNCQNNCEGCHSPWLKEDIGDELSIEDIVYYAKQYNDAITCICFMGTGNDPDSLGKLINEVAKRGYKTCIYTGDDSNKTQAIFIDYFVEHEYHVPEYIKYGSYKKELGGLDHVETNQRMMKYNENTGNFDDITSLFWRKKE